MCVFVFGGGGVYKREREGVPNINTHHLRSIKNLSKRPHKSSINSH